MVLRRAEIFRTRDSAPRAAPVSREPGWTVRRGVLSLIDPEAAHGRGDQLAPREALEGAGELLV